MFPTLRTIARRAPAALPRATVSRVAPFSISAVRKAGGVPAIPAGEGASAGEVPTDENQSTGLERFELLGKLEGIDVFDMKPLAVERLGTMKDPIQVYSLFPERKVGCTGFPADSHDTVWLSVNRTLKNHRCPECGCVYTMDFQGDEHAGHGHH